MPRRGPAKARDPRNLCSEMFNLVLNCSKAFRNVHATPKMQNEPNWRAEALSWRQKNVQNEPRRCPILGKG